MMEPLFTWAATDPGRVRELNEDTVLAWTIPASTPNPLRIGAVLAVADGMGGHLAGEFASKLASDMVRYAYIDSPPQALPEIVYTSAGLLQHLAETLREVNRAVYLLGEMAGVARPGTTLTLCVVRGNEFFIGHIGDSRAYRIRHRTIEQLTEDDSWVAEAQRSGKMSEDQARNSPFLSQLSKSIGTAPEVDPSVYHGVLSSGDVLLLCSDGLVDGVSPAEIAQAVDCDSLERSCTDLITLANVRGGRDNISIAVARYGLHQVNPDQILNVKHPPAGRNGNSDENLLSLGEHVVGSSFLPGSRNNFTGESPGWSGAGNAQASFGASGGAAVAGRRGVDPLVLLLCVVVAALLVVSAAWIFVTLRSPGPGKGSNLQQEDRTASEPLVSPRAAGVERGVER